MKDPTKIKTAFFSRIINTLFLFEKMLQLLKIGRKNSVRTLRSINKAEDCSQPFFPVPRTNLFYMPSVGNLSRFFKVTQFFMNLKSL